MSVIRPDQVASARFLIGNEVCGAEVCRGQNVHEAFHGALPTKYTVGRCFTFSAKNGDPLFADYLIGQIADLYGSTGILTRSSPIWGPERRLVHDRVR